MFFILECFFYFRNIYTQSESLYVTMLNASLKSTGNYKNIITGPPDRPVLFC